MADVPGDWGRVNENTGDDDSCPRGLGPRE